MPVLIYLRAHHVKSPRYSPGGSHGLSPIVEMRPAPMLALAAAVLISVVAAHPCNRDTTVKVHMEQPHSLPGYAQVWRMRTETAEIAGFSNVTGHISECWRAGAPYGPKDVPCGQQGVQQCGVDEHSASKSCLEKPDCEVNSISAFTITPIYHPPNITSPQLYANNCLSLSQFLTSCYLLASDLSYLTTRAVSLPPFSSSGLYAFTGAEPSCAQQ